MGISSGNSLGKIGRRVGWGKQNDVESQNSHCSVLWLACCELVGQVHLQCHDGLNPQKQGMRQTFLKSFLSSIEIIEMNTQRTPCPLRMTEKQDGHGLCLARWHAPLIAVLGVWTRRKTIS